MKDAVIKLVTQVSGSTRTNQLKYSVTRNDRIENSYPDALLSLLDFNFEVSTYVNSKHLTI